jgi:chemotaxis protein methyltransferase CheR
MSALAGDDYLKFCDGLRQLTGVDLTQYKRPQMERRLRSFLERRGFRTLSESLPSLRSDRAELDALLDRMTINVSQLWRNPEHWHVLEKSIIPELGGRGRLRCWSAGSSYGAEAYTLAALGRQAAPKARIEVLGTDIDRRMVDRAKEGVFSAEDARSAPPEAMRKWFEPVAGGFQARQELRSICRFEVGDLLRIAPPRNRFDLILCRNTVIYFSEPIRDELHARLAGALVSGGYLMVGATERVANPADLGLEPAHPFILRKV